MKTQLVTFCSFPLILAGCHFFGGNDYPPLEVVPSVDLGRYVGKWYEIASVPVSQQRGCSCTTAEYSLSEDGTIRVVNTCRKGGPEGEISSVDGKAFVVPNSNNAKLKVQFFWPFRGDYWILELDTGYRYALVGTPNRKYFWILSRTPEMDESLLNGLLGKAAQKGFDTAKAQRTVQDCL
jgi:apolipoprotein D and lipocalin family protein